MSEQELLDCVPKMNYGCKGGVPFYALEFVKVTNIEKQKRGHYISLLYKQENGINYETDYPYKQRKTKCKVRSKKAPKMVQTVKMTPKAEKAIHQHLSYSPVIVGVYLNQKVWKDYESGYISAKACKRNKINHAVSQVHYFTNQGSGRK